MAPCCASPRLYSLALICSGLLVNLLIGGMAWAVGLFYVTFLEQLEYDSPSQVAFGTSLNFAMFHLAGPVGGALVNRFGCRKVGMLGGLLAGGGLVLTIFLANVHYMCFMFGAVSGTGLGFSYMSFTMGITGHFIQYRPLVFGICSSATGLGGFLFPVIIRQLLHSYAWRGTLLILGGVTFNIIVGTAIIRQDKAKSETENQKKNLNHKESTFNLYIRLFNNRDFVLLCISNVFIYTGRSVVAVHLGEYAISMGIDEDSAAWLYSTIGATSIFGKIFFGSLIQIPGCTGIHTFISGFILAGMATLLTSQFSSYIALHCLAGLFGLGVATHGVSNLESIILFCGSDHAAEAFGVVLLFVGVAQGLGGPLASVLYQATKVYSVPMYFGGGVTVLGALIMFVPLISRSKCFGKKLRNAVSLDVDFIKEKELDTI